MQKGFFSQKDMSAGAGPRRLPSCGACGLSEHCRHPKMEPSGRGEREILIVAEAPGPKEDGQGKHMVGDAGKLLRKKLKWQGIELDRDCRKTNAVLCHPPESRAPETTEIECCRPNLIKEVNMFRPKLVLLMGGAAVSAYFGHRWLKRLGGINKWRGWAIPDRENEAWVVPMFHPSYVLRTQEDAPAVEQVFNQDLKKALSLLDKPVPTFRDEGDCVTIYRDPREICKRLNFLLEFPELIAFDYETTGRKPHRKGHRIVSCSICSDEYGSFSFEMPPEGTKALYLFKKVMMDARIPKIAQNLKFEDNWTNVILGCPVNGWVWDTMVNAHILDNREGVTGLKFQSFVNFGIIDYDSHIAPFLRGVDEKDANSFNRIYEIPIEDLLVYNGVDSLVEYRLASLQMKEIGLDKYSFGGDPIPF